MAASGSGGDVLTPEEGLAMVPQQEPFRFIDEIAEVCVDDDELVGRNNLSEV